MSQTRPIDRSQLPPGPDGIQPEVVIANQRQRLLSATASLIAERGCGALAISEVVKRAGVSRRTFYELFKDKSDCVLATQRHSFNSAERRIVAACSLGREWPERIALAVSSALDFAASNLDEARLALAPSYTFLEPELARNGLAFHSHLATMLEEGACDRPDARPADHLATYAALGAAMAIGGAHLVAGDIAALRGREVELTQILLAPCLASDEGRRVALAA